MTLLAQTEFQVFGWAHWLAISITVVTAIGITRYARRTRHDHKKLRYTLATILLITVALDPILTLWRYGTGQDGWRMLQLSALPFHLCDVAAIFLAIALIKKHQRLTEIGYLWGLAGTANGLVSPTLYFDHTSPEFYAFFLQHGGVPIAAIFLVWGLLLGPDSGAFRRSVYWSWGYLGVTMILNWIFTTNYGFLSHPPEVATPFDYLGPYPYYLISLQLIAFTLYLILIRIAPKPSFDVGPNLDDHFLNE